MTVNQVPVIEMRNISKQFGTFFANKNINLQLLKGEIHALLGENGAGKSTLMNILSGLYQPTAGDIYMNGEKVEISSPTKATALGIGMVHQHFMLIDDFTVAENIMLGNEMTNGLLLNRSGARESILKVSKQYGLDIDPDAKVRDITVGMQQRVEILKTLYRGADILIFDEPTAVLTPQEIQEFIVTLKHLASEGKSIIIITHKLDEIRAVADRCTVIRRGESIDTVVVAGTSSSELADMMVGRSVNFKTDKSPAQPTDVALEVADLIVEDERGVEVVKQLSFQVRHGEILGIAGIDGNGQSELILAITGLANAKSGSVKLNGEEILGLTPREINEKFVGHIPEDRHKYGLVLDMKLEDNMVLKEYYREPYSKGLFLDFNAIGTHAKTLIERYDVRTTSEKSPASALSGGNQQKAIIARELSLNPDFLIAANPTRGLDVGAIEYIHKALIAERDKNKSVLLMSFELEEILNVSDRIIVMYDGKIMADVLASETNEQEIGLMMAGTSYEEVLRQRQERGVNS
ncbi:MULTISPECIES: ABC transporter ATP-binding protein [unclassified Facklamia]|uniref:ABC transporter ATP-binding protein n=1 Tax=Aerococcaceae TaxID=186827 RepID=UPI0013BD5A8E|nr:MULTISPECIES: ABC transporter ATP-binding protein [unclassified Facklamia]NEW65210.1 ATP-binding cassette domain-containing protein [Facklamia sp. 252]NEW68389.1 ATP-binding cassette domain-containing protein [Facklamia sp. 253]QQD66207.1 ABC transporter ATP-binding protein [Aerococcaceae bacterium zg-252]